MSHVVISAFEDLARGDLQAEGESVAVFPSESGARAHFSRRTAALAGAARSAREGSPDASLISWVLLLAMPLPVDTVEEALEDLEIVIEETDDPANPFGELVLDYEGHQHEPDGSTPLPLREALTTLEGWLS